MTAPRPCDDCVQTVIANLSMARDAAEASVRRAEAAGLNIVAAMHDGRRDAFQQAIILIRIEFAVPAESEVAK